MPIVEITPGSIDSIIGRPDKAYVTPGLEDVEQGSDAPAGDEIMGAAFRQQNTIGSYLSQKDKFLPTQQEEGFDPWSQVKDTPYMLHWDRFADTHNQAAFDMRKAQIDQEEADRRTLATAPWYKSVPAQIAAGALDWPSLLPGGAIVRSAKGGVSILRTAATTGALAGVSAGVQEGALQSIQQTRTPEESINGIGASVILGSLLGAAGGKLLSGAEYRASEEALSRHLMGEAPLTSADMLPVTPREMPPLVSSAKPEANVAGEVSVMPGEETASEPHLSVSGEFELRHGLNKQASEAFGKTGTYEFVDSYEGRRYDDDGGNFGDSVYLDNNGVWTNDGGSGMGRWAVGKVINVKFSPKNGLLVTPETVATIRSKIGLADNEILTPIELKDYASKSGHDSIIIQGFFKNTENIDNYYAEKYGFNKDAAKKGIRERIPFDELDKQDQEILLNEWKQKHHDGKTLDAIEGEGLDKFIERMKEDGISHFELSDSAAHSYKKINSELAQDQVVVLDKKIIKALGEAPKDQQFNGVNFEAGPQTVAAKQQSGDVIIGDANINNKPLTASQMLSDIPGALKSGSIDTMRLSSAPKTEEIDALIDAGKRYEGELIDRLFGEEADKIKGFLRKGNTDKIDDIIYEKFGSYDTPEAKEAMGVIYGTDNYRIINTESLQSLRDRLSNLEFAVDEAKSGAKADIDNLARELAWTAPDLPDISAPISSHSETQRIAVLSLARTIEDMQANNIDPYPILKETVAYTEKRVGGDAEDARLLLDRLSQYANQYMKSEAVTAPEQISGAVEVSPIHQDITEVSSILNEKPTAVKEPQTLIGFIRAQGGIKDWKGELKAADIHKRFPGLVNRKGHALDRMREMAEEQGYLPADSTPDDLVRAVLSDEPVYKLKDQDRALESQFQARGREFERRLKANINELTQLYSGYGTHKSIIDRAAELMIHDDLEPDDAIAEATERLASSIDINSQVRNPLDDDIASTFETFRRSLDDIASTFETFRPSVDEADRVAGESSEGGSKAGGRGEGQNSSERLEDNSTSQTYETGAEGKQQGVIPGAERISDKALAERRAEAPLTGGNEPPGGMFDEANTQQPDIFDQTNLNSKPASVSAAAVLPADLEGNSIAGKIASTIANLSRFPTKGGMTQFTPLLRVLHSPSAVVREIGLKMFENPIYLKKNMEGVASEPAAETFMKTWNAGLRRSVEFMNKSYADYAKANSAGPRLTREQFQDLVGRAMRRGDVSDNQYIQAVAKKWRSDVFDPLKEAAIKAGLLPKDVSVDTASSYFSRMWNRNKLIAQEPKFKRIVQQWIERSMPKWQADFDKETADTITKMSQQGEMFGKAEKLRQYEAARIREREERFGIEPGEVSGHIADEVFNTLTGRTEGTARPELIKIQSRGPLKERTFGIPDYWIEEFLEDNIDRVGERYVRMMSADVELANKFGHLDIEQIKQEINAHYAQLSERAANEKQRMALEISRKSDLTDIEGVWDIMRGVGSKFAHPWERNFDHVSRLARHYNYIRSMGEASLASLSETVRPAMVHGLMPYMQTMGHLLTNLDGIKMSVEEAKLAGNIAEQALGHRMATMSEISDPYSTLSPTEAIMKNLTSVASVWNGIRMVTDFQKSIAAVMTQNRILQNAANYGSISKTEKAYLAYLGIDANMASKIDAQFKQHGNLTDGVKVAKSANWKDLDAQRAFYAAINKDVDSIITTSGVADVPLFVNTPVGAAMMQFRRFALSAHQRVLLRGLQEDQARFLGGMIAMSTIGMMATWLKGISGNREGKQPDFSKKPGWWIAEGLDRSGILAGGMEVANAIEKASGFNPIKSPLQVFDEGAQRQSQRIQNRTLMGAVMGPTVGLVEDINTVAGIPMTMYRGQRIAQGQKNAAERMLPFSSYPFVRQMLRYTVNTPDQRGGIKIVF